MTFPIHPIAKFTNLPDFKESKISQYAKVKEPLSIPRDVESKHFLFYKEFFFFLLSVKKCFKTFCLTIRQILSHWKI